MNRPLMSFDTRLRPRVVALDHFNIVVSDLDRSAAFYREILALEVCPPPPPLNPESARWIYDEDERPIIHLSSRDAPRSMDRDGWSGPTGALHHIALRCEGMDGIRARLEERDIPYETNHVVSVGLQQIFVHDPDRVLLELNFFEG